MWILPLTISCVAPVVGPLPEPEAVVPSALCALLQADEAGLDCADAEVVRLSEPDRYFVTTPTWVSVVDVAEGWVRHLDQLGAMLEGCSVERGRGGVSCHLDMDWGPPARFDTEGRPLNDRFTPRWMH